MNTRPAQPADLAAVQSVSRAAGQTGPDTGVDPEYIHFLLENAAVLIAEDEHDGGIAGWGATRTIPLGAMLTDLFVHPDQQGRGVGAALLAALWPDRRAPSRFTFSSQHPGAVPLYARAGVRPTGLLTYLTGPRAGLPSPRMRVEQVAAEMACAADAELVGGERGADYRYWTRAGSSGAILVRDGGRVVAAGAVIGGEPAQLTHLACPDPAAAHHALLAALAVTKAERVSVCLPGQHPSFTWLMEAGFRITDYEVVMSTADLALPVTWAYSAGLA